MTLLVKKLKKKAFNILVQRNNYILRKFYEYRNERNFQHSLKDMLAQISYILWLNIASLFVSHKDDAKIVTRPYLGGPESTLLRRADPYFLAKSLMEYDVISFDIFDTLILRPFQSPSDLFFFAGIKAQRFRI